MPQEKIVLYVGSRPWPTHPEPLVFNPRSSAWYEKEEEGFRYTFAETGDHDLQGCLIYRLVRRVPVRNGVKGFVRGETVLVVTATSKYRDRQGAVVDIEVNWVRVQVGDKAIWFRTYEVVPV